MHSAVSVTPRGHRRQLLACALGACIIVSSAGAQQAVTPRMKPSGQAPAPAATLERIKSAGKLKLGYLSDTRPFSYKDASGNPAGFSVAVCQKVADAIKAEPNLSGASVEWVPVSLADRFKAVKEGQVDLLCGADTETLSRRQDVDFSIPIFPGGIGALLRTDAPARLREILNNRPPSNPTWRASAGQLLQTQTFAVVSGTTSESWLSGKLNEFKLTAKVVPVESFDAGIQAVLDRKADVFFTDRAVLLDAHKRNASADKLVVLDRYFTYESLRLTLKRGDDDFRLLVDRTLSNLYRSGDLVGEYTKDFGAPDDKARTFFQWITLPE
ncbi:MAG TPA: amino acid ABC transporter substrate-binding protein [Gemmatimonadales bacterium]|nr:amino acid ABC transporter substrate-binding protein [Gemmatimonadales bacterium]